jgi:hypothetical protein
MSRCNLIGAIMRTTITTVIEQLTRNELTHLDLKNILANPRNDPYVGEVSCYRNEDLIQLANAVQANTSLEKFTIRGLDSSCITSWTEIGARALGNALKDHPNLNHIYIDLSTFVLEDKDIIDFILSVTGSAPLKTLYFMFYCDSEAFINQLGALLEQNTSLEHITIQGRVKNDSIYSEQTLMAFARGFSNKTMSSLKINYLSLGNKGINYLIEQLTLTELKHLTFRDCRFTSDAFPLWNELFAENKLLSLDLSGNSLFTAEAQQPMAFLHCFPSLQNLSLRGTGIEANTLRQLVMLLTMNRSITALDISESKLDLTCMYYLKELIEAKTSLKGLSMDFCNINDEQVATLYPTLNNPQLCHLQQISFSGNQKLSATTYNSLLSILKNNFYLGEISPPRHYPQLKVATKLHKIRKQSQFINEAMELANGFYAATPAESNSQSTVNAHTGAPQRLFKSRSAIEFPLVEEEAEAEEAEEADAVKQSTNCAIM